jgi:hypothetical protein
MASEIDRWELELIEPIYLRARDSFTDPFT